MYTKVDEIKKNVETNTKDDVINHLMMNPGDNLIDAIGKSY